MKGIRVFGTALILAANVIAAPRNNNAKDTMVEKKWLGEGSDDSNSQSHQGHYYNSWKYGGNYGTNDEDHDNDRKSTSWTNSLATSSSCTVASTTTLLLTSTISVTVYTTVNRSSTRSSLWTKPTTSASLIFIKNTSTSIPWSTGYSSGTANFSTPVSTLYVNNVTSVTRNTGYSSGANSSTLLSTLYTNTGISTPWNTASSSSQPSTTLQISGPWTNTTTSSSLTIAPFTTHKHHHSHHHKASMTVSSSMIFIAASSTIPTMHSPTSTSPTTESHAPTTTLSGSSAPTGTPLPHAMLCGVHGLPVGDFFLGQLVESKADVDITLQLCYEFCAGIYGIDMGCLSIEFYPEPETGAPRCDLFSESVERSIESIIPEVLNVWYDFGCAVPTAS